MKTLSRRNLLRSCAITGTGLIVAACQPQVVKETVIQEKIVEKPVEKVVKETVLVEGTPQIVEKVVTTTPAPAQSATIRNITRMGTAHTIPYFYSFAEEFTKEHPNIHIEYLYAPGDQYDFKLRTMAAAGDPPEVAMPIGGGVHWYRTPAESMWLDLDPYMEADGVERSEFATRSLEAALNPFTGAMEGLPITLYVGTYGYNKDLFAKAGIPEPPHDWDDASWNVDYFTDICIQLTIDVNGRHPGEAGFDPENIEQWGYHDFRGATWHGMYGFFFGGEGPGTEVGDPRTIMARMDEPKFVQGDQWWQDLIYKHYVAPRPYDVQEFTGMAPTIFHTGKIAITHIPTYQLQQYAGIEDFEWDVCPTVSGPQENFDGAPRKHTRLCIDNGYIAGPNKYRQESWEWVKYCASAEVAPIYSVDMLSAGPARISAQEYHATKMREIWPNLDIDVISRAVDYLYYHENWRPLSEWEELWVNYVDQVRSGERTAAEAYAEGVPVVNANWEEYYAQF